MVMQSSPSTNGTWSSFHTLCHVAASKSHVDGLNLTSIVNSVHPPKLTRDEEKLDEITDKKTVTMSRDNWTSDEQMVASALLELANGVNLKFRLASSTISDTTTLNCNNNEATTTGQAITHLLLDQPKVMIDHQPSRPLTGLRPNLTMVQLTVKNNGQKVLHLPKGFLLQPSISQNSSSSLPMITIPTICNLMDSNSPKVTTTNKGNVTCLKAPALNASREEAKAAHSNDDNAIVEKTNELVDCKANTRESSLTITTGNALQSQSNCFSPSSSANQQNNSASANFASGGLKKRGRKRLYDGTNSADGTSSTNSTNPIKEFRLRQRRRELEENHLLIQLEENYKHSQHFFNTKLEQLYESNNLNIQFSRIKTNSKRGKAKDDDERINRKKMCARRDSKNYRERAKLKREVISKKIQLLESILNNCNSNTHCEATIQVIHPLSYLNGFSDSSTCSSSLSATSSSSQNASSQQRVTSFSSSPPCPSSSQNLPSLEAKLVV